MIITCYTKNTPQEIHKVIYLTIAKTEFDKITLGNIEDNNACFAFHKNGFTVASAWVDCNEKIDDEDEDGFCTYLEVKENTPLVATNNCDEDMICIQENTQFICDWYKEMNEILLEERVFIPAKRRTAP